MDFERFKQSLRVRSGRIPPNQSKRFPTKEPEKAPVQQQRQQPSKAPVKPQQRPSAPPAPAPQPPKKKKRKPVVQAEPIPSENKKVDKPNALLRPEKPKS